MSAQRKQLAKIIKGYLGNYFTNSNDIHSLVAIDGGMNLRNVLFTILESSNQEHIGNACLFLSDYLIAYPEVFNNEVFYGNHKARLYSTLSKMTRHKAVGLRIIAVQTLTRIGLSHSSEFLLSILARAIRSDPILVPYALKELYRCNYKAFLACCKKYVNNRNFLVRWCVVDVAKHYNDNLKLRDVVKPLCSDKVVVIAQEAITFMDSKLAEPQLTYDVLIRLFFLEHKRILSSGFNSKKLTTYAILLSKLSADKLFIKKCLLGSHEQYTHNSSSFVRTLRQTLSAQKLLNKFQTAVTSLTGEINMRPALLVQSLLGIKQTKKSAVKFWRAVIRV